MSTSGIDIATERGSMLVRGRGVGHDADVRRLVVAGFGAVLLVVLAGCDSPARPHAGSGTGSTSPSPAVPSPDVTIAGWTGRKPATIYFSGDAGDIATGLTWSVWNRTEAVGHGQRKELSCVPDCAQGTATSYPVTITLTKPVDGEFTSIVEQTADGRGTTETFTAPDLGQGACTNSATTSCRFS
jgi:hypothetical protein